VASATEVHYPLYPDYNPQTGFTNNYRVKPNALKHLDKRDNGGPMGYGNDGAVGEYGNHGHDG
jgi:hypothetical protein